MSTPRKPGAKKPSPKSKKTSRKPARKKPLPNVGAGLSHIELLQEHREFHGEVRGLMAAIARVQDIDTGAVVDGCIDDAAGGEAHDDTSILSSIPVNPNDLVNCLNHGLELTGSNRYVNGSIGGNFTVLRLKTNAHTRHVLSQS